MWKIIICLLLFVPVTSFSAEQKLFTDSDLEQYPSSEGVISSTRNNADNINSTAENKERSEAEYWCQRATAAKDRLERAQHALANSFMTSVRTSDKYGRKYSGSQAVTEAEIEQNRAENEARAAKDDYESLKEEATRKNIPAGWLSCNYY